MGRFAEIALPASGVLIGVLLVLGPFLATVIRSLLYWDDDQVSLSLRNFAGLFSDSRFYQAVGNTVIDHEHVVRKPGGEEFEIIAIYTIKDGHIARVDFAK